MNSGLKSSHWLPIVRKSNAPSAGDRERLICARSSIHYCIKRERVFNDGCCHRISHHPEPSAITSIYGRGMVSLSRSIPFSVVAFVFLMDAIRSQQMELSIVNRQKPRKQAVNAATMEQKKITGRKRHSRRNNCIYTGRHIWI